MAEVHSKQQEIACKLASLHRTHDDFVVKKHPQKQYSHIFPSDTSTNTSSSSDSSCHGSHRSYQQPPQQQHYYSTKQPLLNLSLEERQRMKGQLNHHSNKLASSSTDTCTIF